jgi:hypothetical protein
MTLRITKEPHTIAETLMKSCATEMAKRMCGNDAKLKTAQILLSNVTIHHLT